MQTPLSSDPQIDRRSNPRALVCATALVETSGKRVTEHLTCDLSAGGVRLCGRPRALVGEQVGILLRLGKRQVRAWGELLRVGETAGTPDFAVRFVHISANAEDVIQDAVVQALARPSRRSILLLQSEGKPPSSNWDWLEPLSPICATATTALVALRYLEEHAIRMGILDTLEGPPQGPEWIDCYPEIPWRAVDELGRLNVVGIASPSGV